MTAPRPIPLERLVVELRDLWRPRDDLMRSAGTVLPDARPAVDPRILTHQGRITLEEELHSAGLDVREGQT